MKKLSASVIIGLLFFSTLSMLMPQVIAVDSELEDEILVDSGGEPDIVYGFSSDRFLVVYSKLVINRWHVYGRIYDSLLNPITSNFVISQASWDQTDPAVATDGTNFFVIWIDKRRGLYEVDLYGRIVNQDGTVEPEILIAYGVDHYFEPTIAFGAGRYFTPYLNASDPQLWGKFFDLNGNVVKDNFFIASPCGIHIDVTYGAGKFVISGWRRTYPYGIVVEVFSTGIVGRYLAGFDWLTSYTAVSYGENSFAVIGLPNGESMDYAKIRILNEDLDLVMSIDIPSYWDTVGKVDIVFGSDYFFPIWTDYPPPEYERLVIGTELTQAGTYGDLVTFPTNYPAYAPSVAFGNDRFVASWEDGRNYPITEVYIRSCFVGILEGDFEISVSPSSLLVTPSQTAQFQVDLVSIGGFSEQVSLSITGLPQASTYSFDPTSVIPTGSSTLSIDLNAPPSLYSFTVTGTGGGITDSATVSIFLIPVRPRKPSGLKASFTDPNRVAIDYTFSLKLRVENQGDKNAYCISAVIDAPLGFRMQQDRRISIGDLAPGESREISLRVNAPSYETSGTFSGRLFFSENFPCKGTSLTTYIIPKTIQVVQGYEVTFLLFSTAGRVIQGIVTVYDFQDNPVVTGFGVAKGITDVTEVVVHVTDIGTYKAGAAGKAETVTGVINVFTIGRTTFEVQGDTVITLLLHGALG